MSPQTLSLTIDPAASAAPFEQVRTQIADQARDGGLPVGYKLPPSAAWRRTSGWPPTPSPRPTAPWRPTG